VSSSNLIRFSGAALILSLLLQIVGFIFHPLNHEVGSMLAPYWVLAHVALLLSWEEDLEDRAALRLAGDLSVAVGPL
jgi:hypothetical protein